MNPTTIHARIALTPEERAKLFASGDLSLIPQTHFNPPKHKLGDRRRGRQPDSQILAAVDKVMALGSTVKQGDIANLARKDGLNVQSLRNAVWRQRARNKKASLAGHQKYVIRSAQAREMMARRAVA